MKPVRSSNIKLSEILSPTRRDPHTGKLVRIPAHERIDAIISHPQAPKIVRSMDPQQLFGLVREVGVHDALELIELAKVDQLQAFVDFDVWQRDDIDLGSFAQWLDIFLQSDDQRFIELYEGMDQEAFLLWFRENVAVYDWEEDIDFLDSIDDPLYTSPCGKFAFFIPNEEIHGPTVRLFIERLYGMDIEQALSFMTSAHFELSSDLQETLFQRRTSRLEEFGYVAFHEAGEVYAWLDPVKWTTKVREQLDKDTEIIEALPVGDLNPDESQLVAIEEELDSEDLSFFTRALEYLRNSLPEELGQEIVLSTMTQLRAVAQRVLVADGGTPGDPGQLVRATKIAMNNISLALEFMAKGEVESAAQAIAKLPLREIHRAGHSVTLQLQRQAREMVRRGNITVTDAPNSLLLAEDNAMVEGLLQKRPIMSVNSNRPFRTMADVQYIAGRMGQLTVAELLFFAWMGFNRDALVEVLYNEEINATPVEMVSFRMLFTTLLLNRILDKERAIMPMSVEELQLSLKELGAQPNPLSWLMERARILLDVLQSEATKEMQIVGKRLQQFTLAFIAETVTWIVDEMLGQKTSDLPREIAQQWVLLRPEGKAAPTHDPTDIALVN